MSTDSGVAEFSYDFSGGFGSDAVFDELLHEFSELKFEGVSSSSDTEVKVKSKSKEHSDYNTCECGTVMVVNKVELVCPNCGISKQSENAEVYVNVYTPAAGSKGRHMVFRTSLEAKLFTLRHMMLNMLGIDSTVVEHVIDEYTKISKFINKKGNRHKALIYILVLNNYISIRKEYIDGSILRSKLNIDMKTVNSVQKSLEALVAKEKMSVTRVSSTLEENECHMINIRILGLGIDSDKYFKFIKMITDELNNPHVSRSLHCSVQSKINGIIYILAKLLNPLIDESMLLKVLGVTDKVIIANVINLIISNPDCFKKYFEAYGLPLPTSQSMRKKRGKK